MNANPYSPDQKFAGLTFQHAPLSTWMLLQMADAIKAKCIVEIGTLYGVLSMHLATWASLAGAQVLTLDIVDRRAAPRAMDVFGIEFFQADAWETETVRSVSKWIADRRCLIYCDGGNKTKELALYQKIVPIGSVVGCHDYRTEVAAGPIGTFMEKQGFVKMLDESTVADEGLLQMFWRRVR